MAQVRNTIKLIKETTGKINVYYDMYASNMKDILNESREPADLIINSFVFGYAQGMKAAKSNKKL